MTLLDVDTVVLATADIEERSGHWQAWVLDVPSADLAVAVVVHITAFVELNSTTLAGSPYLLPLPSPASRVIPQLPQAIVVSSEEETLTMTFAVNEGVNCEDVALQTWAIRLFQRGKWCRRWLYAFSASALSRCPHPHHNLPPPPPLSCFSFPLYLL